MIAVLGGFLAGAGVVLVVWEVSVRWSRAREAAASARQHTPAAVVHLMSALTAALGRGEMPEGLLLDVPGRRLRFGTLHLSAGPKLEEGMICIVDEAVPLSASDETLSSESTYRARCPGMDRALDRTFADLTYAAFAPGHRARVAQLRRAAAAAEALRAR